MILFRRTTYFLSFTLLLTALVMGLGACVSADLGAAPFICNYGGDPECPDGYTCDDSVNPPVCRSGGTPDPGGKDLGVDKGAGKEDQGSPKLDKGSGGDDQGTKDALPSEDSVASKDTGVPKDTGPKDTGSECTPGDCSCDPLHPSCLDAGCPVGDCVCDPNQPGCYDAGCAPGDCLCDPTNPLCFDGGGAIGGCGVFDPCLPGGTVGDPMCDHCVYSTCMSNSSCCSGAGSWSAQCAADYDSCSANCGI